MDLVRQDLPKVRDTCDDGGGLIRIPEDQQAHALEDGVPETSAFWPGPPPRSPLILDLDKLLSEGKHVGVLVAPKPSVQHDL
eukprot:3303263-Pyramimonas_sp.AAC.1